MLSASASVRPSRPTSASISRSALSSSRTSVVVGLCRSAALSLSLSLFLLLFFSHSLPWARARAPLCVCVSLVLPLCPPFPPQRQRVPPSEKESSFPANKTRPRRQLFVFWFRGVAVTQTAKSKKRGTARAEERRDNEPRVPCHPCESRRCRCRRHRCWCEEFQSTEGEVG